MKYLAYFNDPYNNFAKWLKQPRYKQMILLITLFLLCIYYPIWQWLDARQVTKVQAEILQSKRNKVAHQQQILASLQQQHNLRQFSPKLATKLSSLTQHIQQSLTQSGLQLVHSQWFFSAKPIFQLQIEGHFLDLSQFLTALFEQQPQLAVISLNIQQIEKTNTRSISSEIRFQFNPQEN